MIRIALAAIAALAMTVPVSAHTACASYGIRIVHKEWPFYSYRERYCRRWVRDDEVRYYAPAHRDWDEERWRERGGRYDLCLSTEVDVLSTEHQTEDNAREAARKLWMAKTQWTHGGQYMDLDEAAHIRWRCGPSNAHDTAAGRISEAAGVLTGKGGQNVRCALWARPCRVERKGDDIRGRR